MPKVVNRKQLKEIIGFTPHESQKKVLREMRRFTTVVSGRRLGKTIMASYLALRELFGDNKSIWVIAPTHDLASRIWEYLDMWIDRHFSEVFKINKHEKIIENVLTRSKLWAKTTESAESLRGKGLDLARFMAGSGLGEDLKEASRYILHTTLPEGTMDKGANLLESLQSKLKRR